MKYGRGFWVVDASTGARIQSRIDTYPETRGFEYCDGTGDKGEFLLRDFCCDYVDPESGVCYRIRIRGSRSPVLGMNAFDFDWASIPKVCRAITCDKADYRVRVPSLLHDSGFCVKELLPGLDLRWWNRLLSEVMEAYSADAAQENIALDTAWAKIKFAARAAIDCWLRAKVAAGVFVGGWWVWRRPHDVDTYRGLVSIEIV